MTIDILHIEDNEDDAFLIERRLRKDGLKVSVKRVETITALDRALIHGQWDIILSDFNLPGFNGGTALKKVMAQTPEIPFIIISGAIGEQIAVELMRNGAVDYIMKDNLSRLAPVVVRELSEAKLRKDSRDMDQAMQSIVKSIVNTTGEESFEKILNGLCNWVGADSGLIGIADDTVVQSLFSIINHEKSQTFQYKIEGSPCEIVMDKGFQCYPKDIARLFPHDRDLVDMGVESYVGTPLQNAAKETIGVLCIFSGQKIKAPSRLQDYMEIVAAKAASEIERLRSEKEREVLEEQLRQSQKMESIGTLTGGIAHDFNNILSIIVGNTELALDDLPQWNPVRDKVEEIKSASLRATGIVTQLLNFSRKTDRTHKPVNAITVIQESLNFLRPTIPATIEFRKSLPPTDITILADPTQINQVMMNICSNAAQAMEKTGGILEIGVNKIDSDGKSSNGLTRGEYIRIMVRDTGPGIDSDILDRIFDPYFTTKEVGKGSGMGLAVVHGIIQNHGGAIAVESEPGKGTTFIIHLPVVAQQTVPAIKTDEEPLLGSETILFIDDDESIANMTGQLLERLGYKVEIETDPIGALALFKLNPDLFDLVITDMTMPRMTGLALSMKLRKIRPDIPIIVSTGYSSLIDEKTMKANGITGYIMKPVSKLQMAKAIRKALDT